MVTNETPALFSLIELHGDGADLPAPENGPYYVATRTGYMAMQKGHFGQTLTPVTEVPSLEDSDSIYWRDIPKLPASLVGQAWSFFRSIYSKRHSEAMVDIIWSPERGYSLFIPPQKASYGGVDAKRVPEHIRGQMVGTIHSHCDFSAFHSGTDTHDADGHDGLHLTIGKVMGDPPEIALMVSKSKVRWEVKLEDVIDGPLVYTEHPAWWERYVDEPSKSNQGKHISQWTNPYGGIPSGPLKRTNDTINPNTPTVVAGKAKQPRPTTSANYQLDGKFSSLAAIAFVVDVSDDEAMILASVEKQVDEISDMLEDMGIHFDYDYSLDSLSEASRDYRGQNSDDPEDPAYPDITWRYNS